MDEIMENMMSQLMVILKKRKLQIVLKSGKNTVLGSKESTYRW